MSESTEQVKGEAAEPSQQPEGEDAAVPPGGDPSPEKEEPGAEDPDAEKAPEKIEPAEGGDAFPADPDLESERRISPRKGIQLNKLIATQLVDGETRIPLYLHLVDLSEGGMRVNGDIQLPEDRTFIFDLTLEAFGRELAQEYGRAQLPLAVVWQKKLLGGMWVSGLRFVDMDERARELVDRILQRSSPEGRRLRFRLNRVLGVGISVGETETRWLYPLALDLSVEGMKIRIDEALEVGARFPLKIFLEFDLPTVEMNAEVMWREEMGSGRYQVGLKFSELDEQNASTIKAYIDRCLEEEMKAGKL
ncbi:MAG: PilZ domain-containing protein [Armatimonadetes bacterium]|nr:PilZ domain-containing protein [Armatimonadota bacterium]